jgi:uncharacterized protein YacL (UPF0231 family)
MLEHPDITRAMRTGYPDGLRNMINQPEHYGIDYFGDEILVGDEIVEINGEVVLKENFDYYLEEILGVKFMTAE